VQRLGKNIGAYHGDTIKIRDVLLDIQEFATKAGWNFEQLSAGEELHLHTWQRSHTTKGRRIYLSSGIHGDEPAGPLAVRQLLQEDRWPDSVEIALCPCLNPTGFLRNTRENARGVDLNRQYLHLQAPETRAHIEWLERQPSFDVALCLHEDWEAHGFYLYELNPDNRPSLAEKIIQSVSRICPIDLSLEIEGRPAAGGIIRPSADPRSRIEWPEAFWLLTHNKTRHSYTLEAPSDFPLATRVAALVTAVRVVLES
jgi:protein MpaA